MGCGDLQLYPTSDRTKPGYFVNAEILIKCSRKVFRHDKRGQAC